jgi:predicted ATP-dependent protease
MLKEEVVEAVRNNKFKIYGIKTIDEGIEVLAGVKAGKRGKNGKFGKDTINNAVDEKIKDFTEKISKLSEKKEKDQSS